MKVSIPSLCEIGVCSVNEADLTGDDTLKVKLPLINEINDASFKINHNPKSVLYYGTQINKCESDRIKILALKTGFNTRKGVLVQKALFPKNNFYNFTSHLYKLLGVQIAFYFGSIGYCIYLYHKCNEVDFDDPKKSIYL